MRVLITVLVALSLTACTFVEEPEPDFSEPLARYGGYTTEEVKPKAAQTLFFPVPGGTIGSKFGWRWAKFHEGLDIRAPQGTPIYAAHSGIVRYSGSKLNGFGKVIVLEGPSGIATVYAHNRALLVSKGDSVQRGEQIAEVGMTGNASGPHCHFEVRLRDKEGRFKAVNPERFFRIG